MDTSNINLLIIDGDNIIRIAELPAQADGAAVRVKALKGGKFLLVRGTNEPAPEHIVVKRDGDDLMIFTQEGDDTPEIIIEGFYTQHGELFGMAQDGSYHIYESSDSDKQAFLMLEEGGNGALHLSEGETLALTEVTSSQLSHGMMAAGAVAAVGLLTGIVAALNAGGNGDNTRTPAIPSDIQAADNAGIFTGAITPGLSTDDARPVLSGNGTPGSLIQVYDDGQLVGSVTVNTEGRWIWQPEGMLSEGKHSFQFAALARGKQSAKSPTLDFTVDLTPPDKPVDISITDGNAKDLSSGGITNTNPLHLSGKGEPGDTVLLYDGDTLIASTVVDTSGNWKADITLSSEGDHDLRAGFRDPAGNAGAKSEPVVVDYDITPPDSPVPDTLENNVGKDLILQGLSNDNRMNMAGKNGIPGDIVKLYDGKTLIGSSSVKADGSWSVSGELLGGDGNHNLKASFTDPAGNESKPSVPVSVNLDTVAEAPLFTLTDNTPSLTGTAGSVEPHALVTIYNGTTPVASFTARADGSWTWHPSSALSDGSYQFNATQTDAAGNTSIASRQQAFTVATTVNDFNDTTGQGWTFASTWDGVGAFDGNQVQLSGGRSAGHSTAGDIMSRSFHVEAGHTYNFSIRSVVWATIGIPIDNPSHYLTITVDGVKVVDNVQVVNGVYGGSWTASTTGNVVITISDSTDTNGVGSWIVLDNFTVRDQGAPASALFNEDTAAHAPFSLFEHVLALTDTVDSIDLSRAVELPQTTAQDVHTVSLKGLGQNLLNIRIEDALTLGQENQFLDDGSKQLMVQGDKGDKVTLETISGEYGVEKWNAQDDVTVEGVAYHVYQNDSHDAEVLIQQGIQIQLP